MKKYNEFMLERRVTKSGGSWIISLPKEFWKKVGLDLGKRAQVIAMRQGILILRKGITYEDLIEIAKENKWKILYSEPGDKWLFSANYMGVDIVAARRSKDGVADIVVSKKIEVSNDAELSAIKHIAEKFDFKITFEDPELKLALLDPAEAEKEAVKMLRKGKKLTIILSKRLTSDDTPYELLRIVSIMSRIRDILDLISHPKISSKKKMLTILTLLEGK